jgi:3-methyladenine DNA glycosylase AlkC
MKKENIFTLDEINNINQILSLLKANNIKSAINNLEKLKTNIHSAIPEKQKIGKGITWVLNKISSLIIKQSKFSDLKTIAEILYNNINDDKMLLGIPVFLMSEYGVTKPDKVFDFFKNIASYNDWVIKEFAAIGFRQIITSNKELCCDFLYSCSLSKNSDIRRFASETLRPVVECKWIQNAPDYSLKILNNMFKEKEDFPRTSVGNNLSDLSKKNSELILKIIKKLSDSNDPDSYWIAYRACRNLVKQDPVKIMDILKIDEYHYKDRNFYRDKK